MHILLTGASGYLGGHVAAALHAAGHTVRPVSRRQGHDLLQLQRPADWLPLLAGVDAAINAAGIIGESGPQTFEAIHTAAPTTLFSACAQAGVGRVVQISALGADTQAFSGFHLTKRAADDSLRARPLRWMVLRPALVYGPGGASARLFMRLARLPVIPVLEGGRQPVQPVHLSDVMAAVLASMNTPLAGQTVDVVGPEVMPLADWLQAMRRPQGLPPGRLLDVPLSLARGAVALGALVTPLARPDNLRMLRTGYTASPEGLARAHPHHSRQDPIMSLLTLKTIHIFSMVLLFGTGLGSAFYKWMADRSGNVVHMAVTNRHVVLADWLFTTPTVIIQPLTGLWMVYLVGWPLTTPWIATSLILYVIAGICWVPVVWLQIRMRQLTDDALAQQRALPASYWRLCRWWFWLGIPAFSAVVAVVALMVGKHTLWS